MHRRLLLAVAACLVALVMVGLQWPKRPSQENAPARGIIILDDQIADADLCRMVESFLVRRFHVPTRVEKSVLDFSAAHRAARKQWDYTAMLRILSARVSGVGRCVLLTSRDTFGGPRTYWSTGIADSPGPSAVVSMCRLDPRFWGKPGDDVLLYRRVRKLVLHELGHTFGLSAHCDNPVCVMHQSNTLQAIDETREEYCAQCSRVVTAAVAKLRGSGNPTARIRS